MYSTVTIKMATGTFKCNALRTKTLKEHINTEKNCRSFKLDKGNAVSIGMTPIRLNHISLYAKWA